MSASQHMRRFGQAIGYYPELTKVFGSVTASILFAQLFYWQPKAKSELGVYKTAEELKKETGLSVDEQRGARKQLVKLGVLIETHKRLEHRIYYRIDESAFDELWDERFAEEDAPSGETDIPSPEWDIPSREQDIPIRHIGNTEDYYRGLQQGNNARDAHATAAPDDAPVVQQTKSAKPPDKKFYPLPELTALGVDPQVANDWLAVRKAKLTKTALDGVVREAEKAGISVAEVVRICAERGWRGFNASWKWQEEQELAGNSNAKNQQHHRKLTPVERVRQAQLRRQQGQQRGNYDDAEDAQFVEL